jgi:hypothetical protein
MRSIPALSALALGTLGGFILATTLSAPAGCTFVRQGRGSHEIWHSPRSKSRSARSNCGAIQATVGSASRKAVICQNNAAGSISG